jgi:dipeptidyl aminopeptidase/acylaminoacyl peptidase
MISRVDPPPGAWPSQLTSSLAASVHRLGGPMVAGDGTVVYADTWDGNAALVATPPHGPSRVITGDWPPSVGTLGNPAMTISADGRTVAYVAGSGDLVAVSLDGGPARILLSGQAGLPAFSPDGRRVAAVTSRPGGGAAVAVVDIDRPDWPRPVTAPAALQYTDLAWLPDGRGLVVSACHAERMPWDHGLLLLVSLEDGRVHELVPAADGVQVGAPRPAPDGRRVAYVTDADGWLNLWTVDPHNGRRQVLLSEPREHIYPAWSPDGRQLAHVSRRSGDYRLAILDVATGEVCRLHDEAGLHGTWFVSPGSSVAWWPDGSAVVTTFSSPTSAVRVGAFPIDGSPPRWLTDHGLPASVLEAVVPPVEIMWKRAGMELQGWLHRPARDGRWPLAVHMHGGPTGDAALWWYAPIAHLVSRGWAVLDVNYRGSVGFGRAYQDALFGGWGVEEIEDAVSGVEAARAAFDLSPVTVMFGVSAGGYSSLMAAIIRPDIFKATVCGSGVTDLTTLPRDTHLSQRYHLDAILGPQSEYAALYRERSPLYRVHDLTRPVLVWHGVRSLATPLAAAEAFAERCRVLGRDCHFVAIEGEAYGGTTRRGTIEVLDLVHSWLEQNALGR